MWHVKKREPEIVLIYRKVGIEDQRVNSPSAQYWMNNGKTWLYTNILTKECIQQNSIYPMSKICGMKENFLHRI